MKTDLQVAKTVKLCNIVMQRATWSGFVIPPFVATVCTIISRKFFCHIFSFGVPFSIALKVLNRTLEFINTHLQQWDQVTSVFYRKVCWDTCVLTLATKWSTSMVFAVHNHYPFCLISSRFCCAVISSVWEISCWRKTCQLRLSRHLKSIC